MPAVDPSKIREFKTADAFYAWLAKHHARETEIWIRIHKVKSDLKSITPAEAIDVCLCFGWIDAIRKGFDDQSFLQRYTRRGKKGIWRDIFAGPRTRFRVADARSTVPGTMTAQMVCVAAAS